MGHGTPDGSSSSLRNLPKPLPFAAAIQYWANAHIANSSGMVMLAVAAMFRPGMMPHRLNTKMVMNSVVIIGTYCLPRSSPMIW